jgi:hypothetical protein
MVALTKVKPKFCRPRIRDQRVRRLFTPHDARAHFRNSYSWYRLRPAWWAPAKSKDIVARARSFRVRPFGPERLRMSCASTKCTEVLAERHKSDCRSTAGEDQQGLRLCGLEGRQLVQ